MTFREKWLEAVAKKNSVLCAGIDPAEFGMGRGEKGLPEGMNKKAWTRRYVKAVAPFCAAFKYNMNYWKDKRDMAFLYDLIGEIIELGSVVIEDSKLADIGATNDAGIYYAQKKHAYAVTFSPFAGNLAEAAEQARNREGLGLISMVLMSNPEFKREKNALMPITPGDNYEAKDIIESDGVSYVKRYIQLAQDANRFDVDGIVIGAPSPDNHIKDEEIEKVKNYVRSNMLILCPGIGAQGGEAKALWKYFAGNMVIPNIGRAQMFPKGSHSKPKQQAEAARQNRDMLNELRAAA